MQNNSQTNTKETTKLGSLYTTQAEEFSKTRSAPWSGWLELVNREFIKTDKSYNVLDIGCGNGRFLKFVQQNAKANSYLGLDYSNLLLGQAKKLGAEVLKIDLDNTEWTIPQKEFDFVAAFGIQHHLSSFEIRKYFLKQIANYLSEDGIAVVTYWQFLDYDRYKRKITPLTGDLDYSMSFGDTQNARFCHYTNIDEILKLEENSVLELIETFRADGRDNTENIYRVYKRK